MERGAERVGGRWLKGKNFAALQKVLAARSLKT